MDNESEVTTLQLCPRCQIYKPKKDFVYVAGAYVCTDCSYWSTEAGQPPKSAKPPRDSDE
jgi:hypothetical protein